MTWEELYKADPQELFEMPEKFIAQFQPVELDNSFTIGMAAHGNCSTTLFALRALFASVTGSFNLILVDDASPDETYSLFELASQYHSNTRLFRFKRNKEYSGSLNAILAHSIGTHTIFISNDIFITPSWISLLTSVAEQNSDVGIVRGCANFVDNGLLPHNVKDCGELDNFEALFEYAENRLLQYQGGIIDDNFLTGDAFLVTRKVIDKIGYIDPRFYGYFADHDFALRARKAGFRTVLAIGAFCWHQHGANFEYLEPKVREEKVRSRWARVNENWARFKEKYALPYDMPYKGMRRVPWDELAKSYNMSDIFICPVDYGSSLTPELGTVEWLKYRATDISRQARKLMLSAQLSESVLLCKQALLLDEECTEALTVLGAVQAYQGNVTAAIKTLRKAIRLGAIDDKTYSNLLLCMNYSERYKQNDVYKWSRQWAKKFKDKSVILPPSKRSRIRVAYLSPDFRKHSVSYFFSPLLECHDRTLFEIFCISDVATPDDVTARMSALADGWRDISGLTNEEAENVIREVAPDILVDLAGHTGQTIRLPIFANRPAPINISWIGYPNTTGMTQIDYRFTDAIADPELPEVDAYYSEKLVRLPGCFLCYQPPDDAPDVSPLPALRNGYITFGCFNMLPKLQEGLIKDWAAILNYVPDSKLILKNHYLRDNVAALRLLKQFEKNGVSRDRIELLHSNATTKEHLDQYQLVDVALDTYPYNGTTTTCEALWMGVPVVTLAGSRHASRVGASLMAASNLSELVAKDKAEYLSIALKLVQDTTTLSNFRRSIRSQMYNSVLCNASGFTKKVENTFTELLRNYHEKKQQS